MGPKKKPTQKKQGTTENQPKPTTQEIKKQVKEVKEVKQAKEVTPSQVKASQPKKQTQKLEQKKPAQQKLVKSQSTSQKKINLGETQNLSQAEILARRKLRFNMVGTEVGAQQAEKIKKDRLQKFGAVIPQSKEDLLKRKQKFAATALINLNEDPSLLDKRKQKFGGEGNVGPEDPSIVEDRKKKFGSNDINLDEEIKKSKQKFRGGHHHRDHFKRSRPHHDSSRERYNPNDKRRR